MKRLLNLLTIVALLTLSASFPLASILCNISALFTIYRRKCIIYRRLLQYIGASTRYKDPSTIFDMRVVDSLS